ncbi:PQQ-dependent sugar dehydrogenase [Acidovorax lacteus]|uniref:PQQ-dependent sugar dehydrogenase n=1 Tax=Acidovorax lacteus TaxID=1924988 RepID=A0ABP8L2Z2_9BURK
MSAVALAQEREGSVAAPVRLQTVAQGLEHPWSLAFLPGGRFLVTERPGRLRVVEPDGRLREPVAGLPAVAAAGQGGLLDVALDVDFERNRRLFFCFAEPDPAGSANGTALASARLSDNLQRLEQVRVVFRQVPKVPGGLHFGCRIVQAPGGLLWLALGERYQYRDNAQRLDNHHGKIVRIAPDGSVPADNPFRGQAGALPEIWSLGHRNPQGAALGPDGRLWMHEHGPQGGDEVNRPEPGRNYGWPLVTFGEEYGGGRIGQGSQRAGLEPPLHQWTPSIAPSGMVWVSGERYAASWKGSLLVGSLKFGSLHRLQWDGTRLVREERVLPARPGERIRDVRQGPDGWVYLLTDSPQGKLQRLVNGEGS